jgi:hypothetical protein
MIRIAFLILMFCSSNLIFAQREFKGGFLAGAVTSQISGDGLGGWDKFGLVAGAWVEVPFSDRMALNVTMKYINKGSRTKVDSVSFQTFGYYLNYIDVPLLISYRFNSASQKNPIDLLLGPSIGILLNQKIVSNGFEVEVNPPFRNYEVGAELALRMWFGQSFFGQLAIATSVLPTRPNPSQVNKLNYYESGNYNQTIQLTFGLRLGGRSAVG